MGSLGDLWQIRAIGSLFGQPCENVFWYQQTSTGTTSDAFYAAQGMYTQKLGASIRNVQHSEFTWTEMVATNWTTGLEQDNYVPIGGTGLYTTGDCMPSWVAWKFTYQKNSPLYSSGAKRFAGVPEELVDGNTTSIGSPAIADMESSLQTGLVNASWTAKPVVLVTQLNKVKLNTAMASPPYVTWDVNNVNFDGVTSQKTRKA